MYVVSFVPNVRMAKRDAPEAAKINVGDVVLGNYEGYKYQASVERVFESTRYTDSLGREPVSFYLVRWTGYKGKKALSIMRKCELERAASTEKHSRPTEASQEVAVTISVPPEIFDKFEFKLIYELFVLPEKLKTLLVDQEEQIVEQQIPCPGQVTVRQSLQLWSQEQSFPDLTMADCQSFEESLEVFFNANLDNFLYSFEVPYVQGLLADAKVTNTDASHPASDVLGSIYLVRVLSLFPEIFCGVARHSNLSLPGRKTEADFDDILKHSRLFFSLCQFLVGNFQRILGEHDVQLPLGLYYLRRSVKAEALAASVGADGPSGAAAEATSKRKKSNILVKVL
jgi:hypothetical protein